ncbi:hypothetical protein B0H19DRAFT_1073868 [Mycena capillaripes]|nr:hypothetical protein B0H19DRAFT_1073868 [Mycena capillaripes]
MSPLSLLLLGAAAFTGAIATPTQRSSSVSPLSRSSTEVDISATICLAFNENYSTSSNGYGLHTSISINETVIECIYLDQSSCYYNRHDGSMMQGSHYCPHTINPTQITVSEQVCVNVNLEAHTLIGASITVTEHLLACVYSDSSMCMYSSQGSLHLGGSSCPVTVTASASASVSVSSSSSSSAGAGPASSSQVDVSATICLAFNENFSANSNGYGLQTSISVNETVIECIYLDQSSCYYNRHDGSMMQGSHYCPHTINPTQITVSEQVCINVNLEAHTLIGASVTVTEHLLACVYSDSSMCMYSSQGSLHQGKSSCPVTVTASASVSVSTSSTSSSSSSNIVCEPLDIAIHAGHLVNSKISGEFLVCTYSDSEVCSYFAANGVFDSGSSNCPQSITPGLNNSQLSGKFPGVGGAAAAGAPVSGNLADNNSTSGSGTGTGTGISISKPILIALLAMNGVLVLAVLAIACVWLFGRHTEGRPAHLRALSTGSGSYKTVESVSVPLTHSDEGLYYDAPKH